VGAYSGLSSVAKWRKVTADHSYELLNMFDLRVELAEGSFVDAGSMQAVVESTDSGGVVTEIEERLQVPTQIATSTPEGDIVVRGVVVGVPLADNGPNINGIDVPEGRALDEGDAGETTSLIERNFAIYHELPAEGTLTLSGDRDISYVGHAITPEYFLVITEGGGFFAQASFGAVFTSLETAGEIAGQPGTVNDMVLTLDDGADRDAFQATLAEAFASEMPEVGVVVTNTDDDLAYTATYEDIEGDQQFFTILAVVILLGSAAAAVNLTARMVEQTRREMGVAMALGVRRRRIALRPMLLGVQIAVLGALLGVLAGWAIASAMAGVLDSFLPQPEWLTPTQWNVFFTAALLGIGLPVAAVGIPVWRAIRVNPVDAIRTGHLASRGGGLAPLVKRVRLPGNTFSQMPLRNVMRAPRRGLLTALGIGASIIVLVMIVAAIDSLLGTLAKGGEAATGNVPNRVVVEFDSVYLAGDGPVGTVLASPSITDGEAMLQIPGEYINGDEPFGALVEFIDWDDGLFIPEIDEGAAPRGEPSVVISPKAAEDLDVGIGDTVAMRLPQRTGPFSFALEEIELPVSGIHEHPFRAVAYMATDHASMLGLEGLANVVSVVGAEGVEVGDLQAEFLAVGAVTSVQRADATAKLMEDFMGQFVAIFQLFMLVVLLLAVLIAFNAAAISVDERRREHATMFAYGVRPRRIIRMLLVESAVVGVVATIIGIAGGFWLVGYMIQSSAESMPDVAIPVIVTPSVVVWAIIVGVVAVGLAPLLTAPRRLRKMDLPSTLRVME
ncbi:MAG: FtsX-like permease family protein, partial [Actinomycetota bacterium]